MFAGAHISSLGYLCKNYSYQAAKLLMWLVMLSPSIAFRKNLLSLRIQYLKPLTVCWRSQKTEARHLESQESLDGLRSFGEIPQRNRWRFMYDVVTKTEGFTKPFKFLEHLFDDLGPIYKEDFTMRPSMTVHVIDPDDFEKTLRAEGKYPQRPILDFHLEHRRRRNYFPGLPNLWVFFASKQQASLPTCKCLHPHFLRWNN